MRTWRQPPGKTTRPISCWVTTHSSNKSSMQGKNWENFDYWEHWSSGIGKNNSHNVTKYKICSCYSSSTFPSCNSSCCCRCRCAIVSTSSICCYPASISPRSSCWRPCCYYLCCTGKNPLRSLKSPVCNKPWYCPQKSIVPCTRTIVYHTLMHRGCRTIATDVAPPSPASARARAARVATAAAPPSQGAPVIPAAARALAGVHTTAAPPVMPAHMGQHIVG